MDAQTLEALVTASRQSGQMAQEAIKALKDMKERTERKEGEGFANSLKSGEGTRAIQPGKHGRRAQPVARLEATLQVMALFCRAGL